VRVNEFAVVMILVLLLEIKVGLNSNEKITLKHLKKVIKLNALFVVIIVVIIEYHRLLMFINYNT